jgi:TolB protein
MTRTFFALSFLFASCLCANAAPQRLIAFEKGTAIWIAHLDGTEARKITKGSVPDLSPDGTRIAFHADDSTKKDVVRQIAVVEVMTKKLTVFRKEIPSENCQRAIWSPDGQHILFSIWTDSDWQLAMIDADGSNFRYVKKAAPKNNSFWSACWAPDGKSFYAQDLNALCQFTLDGAEMRKWNLRSLFPNGSLSSGTTIAIAPDGKKLLIDVEMEDESVNVTD